MKQKMGFSLWMLRSARFAIMAASCAVAAVVVIPRSAHSTPLAEEGAYVLDPARRELKGFLSNPELTVDHVGRAGYELYGPRGLREWLDRLGVAHLALPEIGIQAAEYPSFDAVARQLRALHAAYPAITRLIKIGESVQGRDLLVMKISDNAAEDEAEPEVKYIANMHGDEITGRELMMLLIEELASSYGRDPRITRLIDSTEIFIMPSMNPDGSDLRRRANGAWADLNRDFPDFTNGDGDNTPAGRQPETQAVMRFQASRQFALSANFHGGAEVVNYPWDTAPEPHPQEALVRALSLEYASRVPYMRESSEFPGGVTNGYAWYEVNGGMQDWSSYWHGDLQVTIELSTPKWPSYGTIPRYYRDNRDALIGYLEAVHRLWR